MPVETKIIENRIPELVANVNANARRAVKAVADKIASTARDHVAVDTGDLRDTIEAVSIVSGYEAQVVAGNEEVDYAVYQEFGTYKMAAHPFMGPAVAEHEAELPSEVKVGFEI